MSTIAALLPIVNAQQKLVGLSPSLAYSNDEQSIQLLRELGEIAFIDKLAPLLFFVPIDSAISVPLDLVQEEFAKNLVWCVAEKNANVDVEQAALSEMTKAGARIMMNDFASMSSLIWPDTKGVAVDFGKGLPNHIQPWISNLHHHQHLAKNLSTSAQFETAKEAGFSLFSGDFAFALKQGIHDVDPTAKTRLLKLLGLVSRDADSKEIAVLFKQDPSLSYMLLKLVSSAAFAQSVKVTSFVQAVNLLGRRQLQRWLQLLLYARQGAHGTSLNPLMLRAAFRAAMMESLCAQRGGSRDEQDGAFMTGIFSLLDLLFNCPLSEILKPLNLPDDLKFALIDRAGKLGAELSLVVMADRPCKDQIEGQLMTLEMTTKVYYAAILKAYMWVSFVSEDVAWN